VTETRGRPEKDQCRLDRAYYKGRIFSYAKFVESAEFEKLLPPDDHRFLCVP